MKQELICISCPLGCQIEVEYEKDKILSVKGNTCKRGEAYAQQEVFNPERIVTSTVKIEGASIPLLPVKTDGPVPKDKTFEVMEEIFKKKAKAPIKAGDVIIKNILGFGVNLVATKSLGKNK
jgi:CxxC motif-containing protein